MGANRLIGKILYKKEYRGTIEKQGRTLKKFKKVPRHPLLKKKILAYVALFMAIALALGVFAIVYKRSRGEPAVASGVEYY